MNLDVLVHPEKNVRKHPPKQIEEMIRSIEMFGQIRPVIVDENNVILAGNGLVESLREMGKQKANVLQMKDLSEKDKKKLMIADNRIYSLGFDDTESIFELLDEINDFDVPGYDEDVLQELLADDDDVEDMIENFGVLDEEEISKIERGAETKERAIERAEVEEQPQVVERVVEVPVVETSFTPSVEPPKDTAEVERSIQCPHCNGTVWL